MIGVLPTSLEIGGKSYAIRTDYRVILNICQAFNDPDLSSEEKCYVCLKCLYITPVPKEHLQEAAEKAYWFVGGGDVPQENVQPVKVMDWKQDENIIFPAVSKVAGYSVRAAEYVHWWEFIGLFNEVGDGLFAEVVSIRSKLKKGKKLDKYEREFYRNHRNLVDLKEPKSEKELAEEREDQEFLNRLLAGDADWQTDT